MLTNLLDFVHGILPVKIIFVMDIEALKQAFVKCGTLLIVFGKWADTHTFCTVTSVYS